MSRSTQSAPPLPAAERDEWLYRHLLKEQEPPEGDHLTTDELLHYAFERWSPEDVERFDRHLEDCEVCSEDLDAILTVSGPWLGPVEKGATAGSTGYGVLATRGEPALLGRLAEHLGSEDLLLRTAALEVVGALGENAAHPAFLRPLCSLLADADRDSEVRVTAAEAFGKIGPRAVTMNPEVPSALSGCLRKGPEEVQAAAAHAVGNLGRVCATQNIQEALGELCDNAIAGSAARWALGRLRPAIEDRAVIDKILRLLVHSNLSIRRWAGEFLKDAPHAAARFLETATPWLDRAAEIARWVLGDPATGVAGPRSGWPQSGSLAGGRISYELDLARRGEKGEVDLRFGSHALDLENVVLTIDAVPAPRPGEATTSAVSAYLWFVVLGKRGSDQVGARIRIPWGDLPAGSPFGVEFRVRMVN